MEKIDITGERFGKLEVIKEHHTRNTKGEIKWVCRCLCGKEIIVVGGNLRNGHSTACNECGHIKHRASKTKELRIYERMVARCTKTNNKAYKNYGGRGIYVCSRWLGVEGFLNFVKDMGPRP